MRTLCLALATLCLSACGSTDILGRSPFGPTVYRPAADETATMHHGPLELTVDKIINGPFRRDIQVFVRVTNEGNAPAKFDPGQVVVHLDTGLVFHDVTSTEGAQAAHGRTLAPMTLAAGKSVYGKIRYKTERGQARAHALRLRWGHASLVFGHKR